MSGHSKWHNIRLRKGVNDAKRGALFTRLGKAITVAAKLGGGEMETNFKLRLAIEKAKAANMTKDNIEKAIKRGTGEADGGPIETITYEGFGPDGVAIIIECLTDNRNRTSSDMKHILSKHGGNLGGPKSVSWMFEQKGVIRIATIDEQLELELIDAGADDIVKEKDSVIIYTDPSDLKKITELLDAKHCAVEYAEVEWVAKEKKTITQDQKTNLEKLFDALEESEDVNDYYSNAELSD